MRTIGQIESAIIKEDDDGRVFFTEGATIDADGANGLFGGPAAYMIDNSGSEHLANGGMGYNSNGKVVCKHDWARDIVILGDDNEPKVFPGGIIASMTWYRHPGMDADNPAAYIDSETVPYIVVPPLIIQKTKGIVRGCMARATYNGLSVECGVFDKGPSRKIGEMSIAAARALGIPSSPRTGGIDQPKVLYELWPGIPASVNGQQYVLQPA